MNPQATAGRIVHYYDAHAGLRSRAAVVNVDTAEDGMAQLTIFQALGPYVHTHVPYSEEPALGCWSWMPYQKEKAKTGGNVSESAEPRPGSFEDFARRVLKDFNERLGVLEKESEAASAREPTFHPDNRATDGGPDCEEPDKRSVSHDSEAIHGDSSGPPPHIEPRPAFSGPDKVSEEIVTPPAANPAPEGSP